MNNEKIIIEFKYYIDNQNYESFYDNSISKSVEILSNQNVVNNLIKKITFKMVYYD